MSFIHPILEDLSFHERVSSFTDLLTCLWCLGNKKPRPTKEIHSGVLYLEVQAISVQRFALMKLYINLILITIDHISCQHLHRNFLICYILQKRSSPNTAVCQNVYCTCVSSILILRETKISIGRLFTMQK